MLKPLLPRCSAVFLIGLALVLAPSVALAAPSPLDEPPFERVGDAQAIPDAVAGSLAQDSAGFIWIGSSAGLVRFDGYQFRRYTHQPDDAASLAGNLIRSLLATRDGRLWVGTDHDGVSVFDPATDLFRSYAHRSGNGATLSPGAAYAMAEATDGRIWIGTQGGGLNRLDPATGAVERFSSSSVENRQLGSDEINALMVDGAGDLWIGHDLGVTRFALADQSFTAVLAEGVGSGEAIQSRVYSLMQAADGLIWAGTYDGRLLLVDPDTMRSRPAGGTGVEDAGGAASIFSMVQTGPDQIWLGRANGVELRDANGRQQRWVQRDRNNPRALPGNDVRAMVLDRAGALWLTGFGTGLLRHEPSNQAIRVLRNVAAVDGSSIDANISAVLESVDGEIWLGTRESGVAVFDAEYRLLRQHHPGSQADDALASWSVSALAQSADGAVWLGSRDGLHRFDPYTGRFASIGVADGLGSPYVRALRAGTQNRLWVATDDGVYEVDTDALSLQRMSLESGRPLSGDFNAFAIDVDGALLVGGKSGLYRQASDASFLSQVTDPALPGRMSVVGLLVDRQGRLWVDSTRGLLLGSVPDEAEKLDARSITGRIFTAIGAELGLAPEPFGANLLDDEQGRIWSHQFVLDPAAGSVYALTPADGVDFGTGWYRAYTRGSSGQLLFGGSEGLLVIEPENFEPWQYQPPLVLSTLWVDSIERHTGAAGAVLKLAPEQRSFSVEFSALDYSATDKLRYRHRLLGYDENWINTNAEHRIASYANLWPGDYELQLQGSNRVGEWSEYGETLQVRVLPAFWQTPWAAAIAGLLAIGLVFGLIRLRTRAVERRANVLGTLVERRTAELRCAKDRAESALDELRGTRQRLIDAEHMASLGQLVAGVAHEINTPIGIAVTAASHLERVVREKENLVSAGQLRRGDFDDWRRATAEGMHLILGSLNRAHTLIASFKQVAVDQTSEQRRLIGLNRFLEEVRLSLQSSYHKQGHRMCISCPADIRLDTYPGALFQILTNLIMNAVIHGFAPGQHGEIDIEVEADHNDVTLRFSDNGSGMQNGVAEHAFEPFFTTRRGKGGSGLGLHVVYNLTTQLLGGSIELTSAAGQGCTYEIRLPLCAPDKTRDESLLAGISVVAGEGPDTLTAAASNERIP